VGLLCDTLRYIMSMTRDSGSHSPPRCALEQLKRGVPPPLGSTFRTRQLQHIQGSTHAQQHAQHDNTRAHTHTHGSRHASTAARLQVPEALRPAFVAALDDPATALRTMQNKQLYAQPLLRPGALLLGDAFNVRWLEGLRCPGSGAKLAMRAA
jgi:hypothetical protein